MIFHISLRSRFIAFYYVFKVDLKTVVFSIIELLIITIASIEELFPVLFSYDTNMNGHNFRKWSNFELTFSYVLTKFEHVINLSKKLMKSK